MRYIVIAALAFVFISGAVLVVRALPANRARTHFGWSTMRIVDQAEKATVYRIDTEGAGSWRQRVIGKPARMASNWTHAFRRALQNPASYAWLTVMMCLPDPGVVVEMEAGSRRMDVFVCFQCREIAMAESEFVTIGRMWPDLVRLTKEALPNDPVIQSLAEGTSKRHAGQDDQVTAERLAGNPIITPQTDASIGTNINGPSLIRAPSWVEKPLGAYYLYFADHNGKYIRLAYADRLEGPWTAYKPGTLQLAQSHFTDHIASPDVQVDEKRKEIRLYYHGLTPSERTQHTRVAISKDGINFASVQEPVGKGSAYWRLFSYGGWWYALAMPGKFFRSRDGLTGFEPGPQLFPANPTMVHNAVLVRGSTLYVFYTRAGDSPEHILVSTVKLGPDWEQWKPSEPRDVLAPEKPWEGGDQPLTPGKIGAVNERIRALRDPAIFTEGGKVYLLYAVAGESGIAIAQLHF